MKKSSLGHYNYVFQIVCVLLGGTEVGCIADFSVKLSSAQKTVSLVSSKFVCRYHLRNWICGVAQTPYTSWDRIKCNNTLGVSNMPYGSWDSKLRHIGYALHRQRVKTNHDCSALSNRVQNVQCTMYNVHVGLLLNCKRTRNQNVLFCPPILIQRSLHTCTSTDMIVKLFILLIHTTTTVSPQIFAAIKLAFWRNRNFSIHLI
jgi:hypothetical protein